MLIKLYIDIRNRRFVQSASNGGAFVLPAFIRQDTYSLQIQLLEPNPTGGFENPFSVIAVDALALRVGIGTGDPNTLLAYDATWTQDVDNDWFTGTFNLNTTEMEAALEAAGAAGLSKTFEVDVIESGTIHTAIQTPCTIKQDVIRTGVVPPEDYEPPQALVDNLALILEDSDTVDVVFAGDKIHFDATTADAMLLYWTESKEQVDTTEASKWEPRAAGLDPEPPDVVPTILAATVSSFGTYPAGTYRVNYLAGALRYGPGLTQFKINASGSFGFRIVHSGGTEIEAPGNYTGYATVAACEAGNAGAFVEFTTTTADTIGVYLLDTPYDDNTAGTPSPTFELVGANADIHAVIQPKGTGSVIECDALAAAPVPTATSQSVKRFAGGYRNLGGNTFNEGTVSGDDPVDAQDFVTKAYGDANYAGGGVTKWTESDGTYNGKEFSKFIPIDAGADADAIIQPKGTGAFITQEPDGTSVGGEVRGNYATDLQRTRVISSEVASGEFSVIGGGTGGRASGVSSTIAGGAGNIAGGAYAASAGGSSNEISGDYGAVGGGYQNEVVGQYGVIAGGITNSADGLCAAVLGGESNTAAGNHSGVLSGNGNTASGARSAVLNGIGNLASGVESLAAGSGATASGQLSVCLGGISGTASGYGAACIGGNTNAATQQDSGTFAGIGNTASGVAGAVTLGGATNTASGASAACIGGESNLASAKHSSATGGYALADVVGQRAHGCYEFSAGKAQASQFIIKAVTTNATATEMLTGEETRLLMRYTGVFTAWAFEALIIANRTDVGGEFEGFKISGVIAINGGGVGTCALVGTPIKTSLTGGATTWDANVSADTTNGALKFDVNGEVGKTVRWVANISTAEVSSGA